MPIRPANAHRYPPDWPEIRARILRRAGHKCEQCGVANHALVGRTTDGRWLKAWPLEERGLRLVWPEPGTEAWCGTGHGDAQYLRVIRIVLTIAHLDHQPENCSDDNLRAWCQRCHLRYDQQHHQETAYATRREGRAIGDLFEVPT